MKLHLKTDGVVKMGTQVKPNILTFIYQFLFIFLERESTPQSVGCKFAM